MNDMKKKHILMLKGQVHCDDDDEVRLLFRELKVEYNRLPDGRTVDYRYNVRDGYTVFIQYFDPQDGAIYQEEMRNGKDNPQAS